MKHTLEAMKRINSDLDDDHIIASEFSKEALAEATKRAAAIKNVCDLGTILDTEVFMQATNDIVGIRHITLPAKTAAEFHIGGMLEGTFGKLHDRLDKIRASAEKDFHMLAMLFQPSMDGAGAGAPSHDSVKTMPGAGTVRTIY